MLDQDKILSFMEASGPTLPTRVAKNIKTDILLASAHLSDLASRRKVLISNLKVGGSPLYYLPGQEEELYKFAESNVNEKDFLVLQRLKTEKVFRDSELTLMSRVALRNYKDFAIPLKVQVNSEVHIFWKWYLLSKEETKEIIESILVGPKRVAPEIQPVVPSDEKKEILKSDPEQAISKTESLEKPKTEESLILKNHILEEKNTTAKLEEASNLSLQSKLVKSADTAAEEIGGNGTDNETDNETDNTASDVITTSPDNQLVDVPNKLSEAISDNLSEVSKNDNHNKQSVEDTNKHVSKTPEPVDVIKEKFVQENKITRKVREKTETKDKFLPVIEDFLHGLDIDIDQFETIRKHSELDLIVQVPSVVGKVLYFCKAKSKAKCDEKDVSSAYMEAQIKKLPLLFLYKKEITKKAKEMLESGAFTNVIVKKIDDE